MIKRITRLTIGVVEAETGIAKDTLRVWERRYGFPAPDRRDAGQRLYPQDDLDKLRVIKQLVDRGHRPGRLVNLDLATLEKMVQTATPREAGKNADFELARRLLREEQLTAFGQSLEQAAAQLGVERFILTRLAPLIGKLGAACRRGEIKIYEEHLISGQIEAVLRRIIPLVPPPPEAPTVVLARSPGESHGLALLMLEALLAVHGARCLTLSGTTPIEEIAGCAVGHGAATVAISATEIVPALQLERSLERLRTLLPDSIGLWVGGAGVRFLRRCPKGVQVMTSFEDVLAAFAAQTAATSPVDA